MEEYRNWLESVIAEERIAVQGGADDRKLRACEECLRKVEQLKNNAVNFCNLETGKKYVSVSKTDESSSAFVVLDKGCDDKGDYIWYYTMKSSSVAFKAYEQDFYAVKYFKEIKNGRVQRMA